MSGGEQEQYGCETVRRLEVHLIEPNLVQFRKIFKGMEELTESVREKGVQVPIKVLQKGDGKYRIIYGERRWRAAAAAGLQYIPAIVVESGDCNVDEICLIENLHRENLRAVDEVMALREFKMRGYSEKQIALLTGRSNPHISRAVTVAEFLHDAIVGGFLTYDEVAEMELPMRAFYNVAKTAKEVDDLAYGADLLRKARDKHMTISELDDETEDEKYRREFEEEYEEEVKRMKENAIKMGVTTGPMFDGQQPAWDKDKILGTGPAGGTRSPLDEDFLDEGGDLGDLSPGGLKGAEGTIELLGHPEAPVKGSDRRKGDHGEAHSGLSGRMLLKHLSNMCIVVEFIAAIEVGDMVVKKKDRERIAKLTDDLAAGLPLAVDKIKELKGTMEKW